MKRIHYRKVSTARQYLTDRGFRMSVALIDKSTSVSAKSPRILRDREVWGWKGGDVLLVWNKENDSADIIFAPNSLPYLN